MPKLPQRPNVSDPILQKWITHVHNIVETLPPKIISAPGQPSNLRVVPGPGMNRVSFTGGQGAERHFIIISKTKSLDPSHSDTTTFDVGVNTQFPHVVGIPAQQMFYWVVSERNGLRSNPPVGPVSGTTLALNTPLVPPAPAVNVPTQMVQDSSGRPSIPLVILTRERNRL